MLFVERYSKIREELDSDYTFPKSKKFYEQEFQKCRWTDTKSKHLCSILWVLASNGPVTVTEIVENDQYSQDKARKKTRWDIYNRKIVGKQETIHNLIEKGIVYEFDQIIKSKPTQRYSLTLFGAFYAISLFSKNNLKVLDKVAASHKHLLPLVFGKWNIIKKEIGSERRILHSIANIRTADSVIYDPLLNRRALSTRKFKSSGIYSDEISLYFFSRLSSILQPNRFFHFIKINDEIYKWYFACIKNLIFVNNLDRVHINYVKAVLDGDINTAKKLLVKHSSMQGIS